MYSQIRIIVCGLRYSELHREKEGDDDDDDAPFELEQLDISCWRQQAARVTVENSDC